MDKSQSLAQLRKQVVWNRLIAVVEEQAQTLIRTAFSNTVREAGDLSAGVFDMQGRMLAQAVTGTPGHVNAMAASVVAFLDKFPTSAMAEGDIFVTNDPWLGTGHLHDFTVVTPAFRHGEMVGLFASTSHVVDVGGLGFGPDGRQVYEEGMRVPIMHLAQGGEMNHSLLELVRSNVREPIQVEGDLYSLAACNDLGCTRLIEAMAEFELDSLDEMSAHILARSEEAMLDEIRKLPRGEFKNQMRVDGYDHPLDLVACLTVSDDGIDIDFSGTSSMSSFGINVPLTYTQAYASFGVRCVIGAQVPNNAGSLGPVRVSAPQGSILNAPFPAAVSARHAVGQMLPDVVLGCLHQALGGVVPAEGTSCLWNPVLFGGHGIAGDSVVSNATPFAISIFHNGGTGARPDKDGLSATAFPSGVRNTPVEINEAIAPIVVWRKEYREDSGGPGQYRGGTGQVMSISNREGAPFAISSMFDRVTYPARGREGGSEGQCGKMYTSDGTLFKAKGRQPIPAGQTLTMEMPGGGGYGCPFERDPQLVAADVRLGLVSRAQAAVDYGVVLTSTGEVDTLATASKRDEQPQGES